MDHSINVVAQHSPLSVADDDNGDSSGRQVLPIAQVLVSGYKYLESGQLRGIEQSSLVGLLDAHRRVDFAKERNCLAAICARGHVRHFDGVGHPCSRAARTPAGKGNTGPGTQQSNNLANIILDLRYVTGYGSG